MSVNCKRNNRIYLALYNFITRPHGSIQPSLLRSYGGHGTIAGVYPESVEGQITHHVCSSTHHILSTAKAVYRRITTIGHS